MKLRRAIETEVYVLVAAAILSGLVALLDLFGLLDNIGIPGLAPRIPVLSLLLLSLVAGIATRIWKRFDSLDELTSEVLTLARAEAIERLNILRKQISPSLNAVFGEEISNLATQLINAVKNQRIDISTDLFVYFYKNTLVAFPRASFVATSLPYRSYFWGNLTMEEAIKNFIANGGKMKRLFFLNSENELNKAEVKGVLQSQLDMGVDVYTIIAKGLPSHLQRFYVADSEKRIAWEAHIGANRRITHVVATSDPETIRDYLRISTELFDRAETRRYPGA